MRFDETKIDFARAFLDAILSQMEFGGNEEILNDNVLRFQNEPVRNFSETLSGRSIPIRSWKEKDRIVKTGDNVMVDDLPSTDIVIPCDSIHFFIISLLTSFSVMDPAGVGKSTVCSS